MTYGWPYIFCSIITIVLSTRSLEARMNERKDTYGERKELSYGGGPKEAYGGSGQKEQYSISEFLTKMAQGEQVQIIWMESFP